MLQAFATDVEFTRLFLGRTSASGSLDVDATFASSRIGSLSNRVISLHTPPTGGNLAVHIVAGGPLIQDPTGSSIEIVPTPPSGRGYAAVLEFSASRSLGSVYLATEANIRTTGYRGDALTIALAQGGDLTRGGVVVVPAPLSDVPITITQLTGGLIATIAPFRLGEPPSTSLTATFAFEPDGYGIGLTGTSANGNAYVTTDPSWTVGADRLQYVAFLNSTDGLICAER